MDRMFVRAAVVTSLAELVGCPASAIVDQDELSEMGIDSMLAANLLVAIESRIGLALPEGAESGFAGVRTVEDVVAAAVVAFSLPLPAREPGA